MNKQLLSSVKSARQGYESDLNAKRKLDQAGNSKENNDKEVPNRNGKTDSINKQIQLKKWFGSSWRLHRGGKSRLAEWVEQPKNFQRKTPVEDQWFGESKGQYTKK